LDSLDGVGVVDEAVESDDFDSVVVGVDFVEDEWLASVLPFRA
jgi:hypothetical protein